jgi:hypothetical protein
MPALTDYTSCCPRVCPRGGPPHRAACYKRKGEPRVLPGSPCNIRQDSSMGSQRAPFSLTQDNHVRGEWEGSEMDLVEHAIASERRPLP